MVSEISSGVFWKAAAITLVIFLVGISAGWFLDEQRISEVRGQLDELKIQADEARVALAYYNAFKDDPAFCSYFPIQLNSQIDKVGAIGENLEKLRAANRLDSGFFSLKRQFVLYSAELWLSAVTLNKQCALDTKTVLYFYPDQQACADCFLQSQELLALKKQCPNTLVFALPTNLNVTAVDILLRQYGIAKTPSIVVNGKEKFDYVVKKAELERIAC